MNAIRILIFWASFLSLLVSSTILSAQNEFVRIKSEGAIFDKDTEKKLDGVQIIVFKNGAQDQVVDAGNSGKFDFTLPLGYSYDIKFSRADYVTKIIRVDTRNIPTEDRAGGFLMEFKPSLFKYIDGFNTDILKEPIRKSSFISQTNSVSWDNPYGEMMDIKIEEEFKRLADLAKNGDKQKKEFDKLILEGDGKMTGSKYEEAMNKYKSALAIFPSDKPAQDKYDEAERKYKEFLDNKNNDAQYTQLIKDADVLFKNQNWESAKNKYAQASVIRNSEIHPKNQITEIDKKLLELENEKKFKALVARADQEFNGENFETSINSYEEALLIKSNDTYSKKQIEAAKAALLAISNDKNKQEEIELRYKALITTADDLFSKKQYLESIAKYESASSVKPNEDYPQDQIDKANKAINASKTVVNNTPPAVDPNLAQYKKLLEEGDKLLQESNMTNESKLKESRSKYNSALALKNGERYPTKQIETIEQALANLNTSANNSGESWREKRIRQENELEEVRRLKEQELEEARAARLAEKEAAEAEELRKIESQEEGNSRREIDLSAEEKVEEFYKDAQKKAEKRKILDIIQEKSRDSLNRTVNQTKEQKVVDKEIEEIEKSEDKIYETSKNNEAEILEAESKIKSELELTENLKEDYRKAQARNIETANTSIEREQQQETTSRKNNKDKEKNTQRSVSRELERENETSYQYTEKEKQKLTEDAEEIQNSETRQISLDNESRKIEDVNLKLEQSVIENEREANENSRAKGDEILERTRIQVNSETHASEIKEIEKDNKEGATADKIRKEISEEEQIIYKPKVTEEISERSYETSQPSINVLETTVKKGSKVIVYRKVVSKSGTFYYQNDECISVDQWLIETKRK
jgi:hypothetical protein